MKLKKNDRIRFGDKLGTVVGNSYRAYDNDSNDRYCEILLDGYQYIDTVKVELLEKL